MQVDSLQRMSVTRTSLGATQNSTLMEDFFSLFFYLSLRLIFLTASWFWKSSKTWAYIERMSAWLLKLPSMFQSWPMFTTSTSCFFTSTYPLPVHLKQSSRTLSLITSLLCWCFWWLLYCRLLFWHLHQLCIFDHPTFTALLCYNNLVVAIWFFSCCWHLCSFLEVNPRRVYRFIPLFPFRSLPKTPICFFSWAQPSVTVIHHHRPNFTDYDGTSSHCWCSKAKTQIKVGNLEDLQVTVVE